MTVEEFARVYKYRNVTVDLDEVALDFANAWSTIVLANHLMTSGENQFNLGKDILKDEERRHTGNVQGESGIIIQ